MKLTEFAALGFRLFGLYLLLNAITGFIAWVAANSAVAQPALTTVQVGLIYLLPVAISLALILFPVTLAKLVVPSSRVPSPELRFESSGLLHAGTALLGLYFVARAIPDFVHNIMVLVALDQHMQSSQRTEAYINEFITVIELAVGLYLVFGARGLVHLIERFRMAGLPKDSLPPEA